MGSYKVVSEGGCAEITEKKSRFIACVYVVNSEEEAAGYIEEIRKKYWDARHHCYAYVLGSRGEVQRFSDDGEPGGTAGRPILDTLVSEKVRDSLIIVTRYFGGVLLGTGGLVRAYSQAAREGLRQSRIVTKQEGYVMGVEADYVYLGKLQHFLARECIPMRDISYGEKVGMSFYVKKEALGKMQTEIDNITGGQVKYLPETGCWFAVDEDRIWEWEDHA